MKKKMTHDRASVNLLMASIWWVLVRLCSALAYSPLNSRSVSVDCTLFIAIVKAPDFSRLLSLANTES